MVGSCQDGKSPRRERTRQPQSIFCLLSDFQMSFKQAATFFRPSKVESCRDPGGSYRKHGGTLAAEAGVAEGRWV